MSIQRPKILITAPEISVPDRPGPQFNGVRSSYVKAVYAAGGLPIILPMITDADALQQLVNTVDGVVFSGGEDIQPHLYGDQPEPGTVCCPVRDEMELKLAALVDEKQLPCLAICRGCQLWGVYLGAKLIQELNRPDATVRHDNFSMGAEAWTHLDHTIHLEPTSKLAQIAASAKNELLVNSLHHQAIDPASIKSDSDLRVVATSSDGVVEAIERKNFPAFFLGIQCHIETLAPLPGSAGSVWHRVFKQFVDAARD